MKMLYQHNILDLALRIFSALRNAGVAPVQLRCSRSHGSASKYIYVADQDVIRISNHAYGGTSVNLNLLIWSDISLARSIEKANDWLENNYGISLNANT